MKMISKKNILFITIILSLSVGFYIIHTFGIISIFRQKKKNDRHKGVIVIKIDPSNELHPINRLIYGTNIAPKMESDPPIWRFIDYIGLTCFRYPGGDSPGWHWRGGYADYNEKVVNMPMGRVQAVSGFSKKTGMDIIMQINIETGTPKEAAGLVHYMNKQSDTPVTYWEIGNEAFGDWDMGYQSPLEYVQTLKNYSAAMKTIDPNIKIGANWGERYFDEVDWDRTIIRGAADAIDFVSIHWYPNHTNPGNTYRGRSHPTPQEVMANSLEIPTIVERVHSIIAEEAPHRKGMIEIGFLEWDGAWDAPTANSGPDYAKGIVQWSLANAIFYADTLGQFAQNGISVATHYRFQECPYGLIRGWHPAEGGGGVKWDQKTIRPKAYAIKLFKDHFGDISIKSTVVNSPVYMKERDYWASSYAGEVPYISAYASKFEKENKLGIILINKHATDDIEVVLNFDRIGKGQYTAHQWILSGPNLMSQNDGHPGLVKIRPLNPITVSQSQTYTVPAHSIIAMEIKL